MTACWLVGRFHFDKDEDLLSSQDRWSHPLLSSVVYLTDHGAPTVVFDTTVYTEDQPPQVCTDYVCRLASVSASCFIPNFVPLVPCYLPPAYLSALVCISHTYPVGRVVLAILQQCTLEPIAALIEAV